MGERIDEIVGIFRGKVLDNNDPQKLGRIKVEIYPFFVGINANILPWAVPAMPLFTGAGSDKGSFCVPDVGSYVFVFFENGDMYQPVYFAEAVSGKDMPQERVGNYPSKRVFKLSSGIVFEIDDRDKVVKLTHPSNAYVVIDSNGNITISGTTVSINPV
jgi:hypothetical protein